jgi:CheY-like chemotaxis protein
LQDKRTILLVEDHEDDISLLRNAFSEAGLIGLQVVHNGDEAIDYLEGHGKYDDRKAFPCPALILLDLKMPRRTGFEVLEWVRANGGYKRMPIVILTDSANTDDVNHAYDLGVNSYLIKPLELEEIVRLVRAFVEYWLIFSKHPTYPSVPEVC